MADARRNAARPLDETVRGMLKLEPGEGRFAWHSALLFFLIMTGYFILRPLREEMGLAGGVRNLPYLYLATLASVAVATPLFGMLVRRYPREVFLPLVYRFFALNLAVFFVVLKFAEGAALVTVGRVFYVWLSVCNMFLVSLYWAFMSDGWGYLRSKRVFGVVAIGGTVGAILGSGLTTALVETVGRANLLLLSIAFMEAAARLTRRLSDAFAAADLKAGDPQAAPVARAPGEGALAGVSLTLTSPYLLAVSAYLMLYSLTSTFLYFQQAHIVDALELSREAKAAVFGRIDLWVNVTTLAGQLLVTGRLLRRLGTGPVLALLPAVVAVGFAALGAAPVLSVLILFQVARRAVNYAFTKPAREILFTTVDRNVRWKAKSFIDTFVYRGGDALGAGVFDGLTRMGIGLVGVAWLVVPSAVAWCALGLYLGRRQQRAAAPRHDSSPFIR
jgi:AAA family ATP:ADP antiporter